MNQQQLDENKQLWDEIQHMTEEDFSTISLAVYGLEGAKKVYYDLLKYRDVSLTTGIPYWIN